MATFIAVYLGVAFAMLGWIAYLDRQGVRVAFWASLLWPLVILAIPVVEVLDRVEDRFGWLVEIEWRRDLSMFGFRRRPGGSPGWAIRGFWIEMQAWKKVTP